MDKPHIIALIAVAALLPFERLGSLSVAGFNIRLSQIALVIAWLLFFRALARGANLEWKRPAFVALAGFFAAVGISLVNAENFERSLVVLGFTVFTASLALIMPSALPPQDLSRVRIAILMSAAIVSVFGLWQFVGDMLGAPAWLTGLRSTYTRDILGFTRVQSTAAEPLYFANYLLLPIALAGTWLLRGPEKRVSKFLAALLGIMVLNVFLTSSRGGWLGLSVTLLALLWLERSRLRNWKPIASGVGVGLAAIALGVMLLGRFFSPTLSSVPQTFFRHVTTVTDGAAFDDRASTFSSAIEAWKRRPWIGVGYGGYGPHVSAFTFTSPESGWPIVNNETLELLAETGVLGLTAFVIFLFFLFRGARQSAGPDIDHIRIACVAALLGMLAQYQTFSTLYIMHVWFTIGLILIASKNEHA